MSDALHTLALTRLRGIPQSMALTLYRTAERPEDVFHHPHDIPGLTTKARTRLDEALRGADEALRRAESELEFAARNRISVLLLGADGYPARLAECPDPPVALFYRGTAELNARRVLAVVGTRHITEYGKDICRRLCADLYERLPDTLIISGLAYGVDIHAHREALALGLPTAGVLAHGLDTIYPASHRATAAEMVRRGGLLTEYMSATRVEKAYFLRRNRIVAGMADATIVVESAARGGALTTARLAQEYDRTVFAFPGRAGDQYSEGCNALIRNNVAELATSADDILRSLGWAAQAAPVRPEPTLFPSLSEDEQRVLDAISHEEPQPINRIAIATGLPVHIVSAALFELEMKGLAKALAGGAFRALR